jgi:AcrR family transcriptional regulator
VSTLREASPSRTSILDAAEAAFARAGFEGTTFSDICEAAGVSRGLPSYLFGNKNALYKAVVSRAAERLRAAVIEPLRGMSEAMSIDEAITLIVETYVDYLAGNAAIVRLLQWELLSDPDRSRPFAPTSELFSELLGILEKTLERHGRAEVDSRAVLGSIVALCYFPFVMGKRVDPLGDTNVSDQPSITRLKRRILALLQGGLLCVAS